MELHDERFLRLRTKRADGRSGSGAENRERQASRRYDMTPDTEHPRSQLRRGIMKLEWSLSSLLPVEIEVWPRQPASMASQRTDTSDIPSIDSIREFHVKDESKSIALNYLRLLLLERFSLLRLRHAILSRTILPCLLGKGTKTVRMMPRYRRRHLPRMKFHADSQRNSTDRYFFPERPVKSEREENFLWDALHRIGFFPIFFSLFYLRTFHGCQSFECGLRCMHCVNKYPNYLPPGKIALPLTSTSIQTFAIERLTAVLLTFFI